MIALILFFILLAIGLPIIFLLIAAAIIFVVEVDATVLFSSFAVQSIHGIEASGFLAIPLYMLVGELMTRSGITERLIRVAEAMMGNLRGGLAYVNVLSNAFAAAILGSATAQISVMSRSIVPEMVKRGYNPALATGITVSAGLLGPIVPPSMLMIIYGTLAYQSVATLFIAGIIPGILITAGFFIVIGLKSKNLPKSSNEEIKNRSKKDWFLDLLPILIPTSIVTGVVSGAMTPTEAGGFSCLIVLFLAVVTYRTISWKDLVPMLTNVVLASSSVIALIGFASLLGWVLSYEGIPDLLALKLLDVAIGPISFMVLVCLVIFVLGMFLDGIGIMIVVVPILLPIAIQFGIDPIHFGVVVAIATLTGLVSPPVGPGLYIAMEATGLKMMTIFKAALPFMAALVICLILIILLPSISVWLPKMIGV